MVSMAQYAALPNAASREERDAAADSTSARRVRAHAEPMLKEKAQGENPHGQTHSTGGDSQ